MTFIHPIRLRFSNASLLVGEQPILVDTGSPGEAGRIVAGCAEVGVPVRDLALILHTHVHSDHCGSTADIATATRCPVSFHPADLSLALQGHNGALRGVGLRGRLMSRLFSHTPFQTIAADLHAEHGMRLDRFGVAGSVHHTPGHTAGSISVLLDSGDALVGDLLMGGYAGGMIRRTKPNMHYFAEDPALSMRSLGRVLSSTSQQLQPGHGGPLRHADVVRWYRSRVANDSPPPSP